MSSSNKVGIVAENATDLHTLRAVVTEAGLEVVSAIEFYFYRQGVPLNKDVEAWILNLDIEKLEQSCPEKVDDLIDAVPGMLILCEGGSPPTPVEPEYNSWKRRLLSKIQDIAGTINLESHGAGLPNRVWVLAGSIGGPESIKLFLDNLPEGLDVAFVYANHLQADFQGTLAQSVAKNAHYPAHVAAHGQVIKSGEVFVISPEHTVSLQPNGTFLVGLDKWYGQYQPNLDHVIASVAKTFGHTGGVIIFSGMCDDGAASCRMMKQNGGKVWAQQPDTCVSSAMPDAAIATGCVDKIGTPQQLAAALAAEVAS